MAMRSNQTATLDEISSSIGELKAYTHEHRHGVNNVSMKIDALGVDVSRRLERVEQKLGDRIDAIERKLAERIDSTERKLGERVERIDAEMTAKLDGVCKRLDALETDKVKRDGARGAFAWLLDKWPSLTAAAAAVGALAHMKGLL